MSDRVVKHVRLRCLVTSVLEPGWGQGCEIWVGLGKLLLGSLNGDTAVLFGSLEPVEHLPLLFWTPVGDQVVKHE